MKYSYKNLKRKVAFEILTSWLVMSPLAIGLTILIGVWAVSFSGSGLWMAIGALLTLVSGAIWVTRFFGGSKTIEERVLGKIKAEIEREDRKRLDSLDARLVADGDGRTEFALRDLRNLRQAMLACETTDSLIACSDVIESIEALFDDSVKALDKSLSLSYTINSISTYEARANLMEHREKIIEGVQKSIIEIGKIVGDLQVLASSGYNNQDELRGQLSDKMEVVSQVHQQMTRWEAGNFEENHITVA